MKRKQANNEFYMKARAEEARRAERAKQRDAKHIAKADAIAKAAPRATAVFKAAPKRKREDVKAFNRLMRNAERAEAQARTQELYIVGQQLAEWIGEMVRDDGMLVGVPAVTHVHMSLLPQESVDGYNAMAKETGAPDWNWMMAGNAKARPNSDAARWMEDCIAYYDIKVDLPYAAIQNVADIDTFYQRGIQMLGIAE